METNLFKSINLIRCVSGANLNLFRYAAMVAVLLMLGAGNAWAGHDQHTATLNVAKGTGNGSVYASTSATATSGSASASFNCGKSSDGQHTGTLYAYATPASGYTFLGWTTNASSSAGADNANPKGVAFDVTDGSSTQTLYAHFVEKAKVNITFEAPSNGTYTIAVNGGSAETVSSANVVKNNVTGVTLTATPASGYAFAGWYKLNSAGEFVEDLSIANPYDAAFTKSETIKMGARFVPTTLGKFILKGSSTEYYGLKAATVAAGGSGTIVPVADETLVDGSDLMPFDNGTYSIKAGATLLIPYSSANEVQTKPKDIAYNTSGLTTALSIYKKLITREGVSINVMSGGVLCVGGQLVSYNGGNPSAYPIGACGVLDMSNGGHIELDGTIYCWGFIKGQDMDQGNNTVGVGTIAANSGSVIWEDFAVGDWRGGTACSTIAGNASSWKFFPFQSYTIQNVEVPTTYHYGATLSNYTNVYGGGGKNEGTFSLIGKSNTLFQLKDASSSVCKWYDPTTDLVNYEMRGTAQLDALNVDAGITTVSSSSYNLPLSSNMQIVLAAGCNMTLSKPMVVQPGAVVEVKSGASLTLSSNTYIFDVDNWGMYCNGRYFYSMTILTSHKNRGTGKSKDLLDDAKLIVDGTLNVTGKIYATDGGANIMGNGAGSISLSSLGSNGNIVMCTGVSTNENVAIAQANLCNEDESYTKSIASTTFYNVHGRWFKSGNQNEKANHTYDFTYISSGAVSGTGGTSSTTDALYAPDKTGLAAGMKWCNVVQDGTCSNIFNATQALNETPASDIRYTYPTDSWLQLLRTETEGVYGGSDNSLYAVEGCAVNSLGSVDENCLYTINDVKKALVDGHFVALEKNTEDEAWHDVANTTNYYISFAGCTWHPATKYAGEEKAYIVEGGDYIWYNNDWLLVEREDPFFFDYNDQNVKRYYEYEDGAWVLASPRVRVQDAIETRDFYFINEAFTVANGKKNTTITLLKDIPMVATSLTYSAKNTTCTLDLNGHTMRGAVPYTDKNNIGGFLVIDASGSTFTITDNTTDKNGRLENICEQNQVTYTVRLVAGTLYINAGYIYAENPKQYSYGTSSVGGTATNATDVGTRCVYLSAGTTTYIQGGTIHAKSSSAAHGIFELSSKNNNTNLNISNGTIYAEAARYAYGVRARGKLNITGGLIKSRLNTSLTNGNETYMSKKKDDYTLHRYGYGVYVEPVVSATASENYGGTLTMSAGRIESYNDNYTEGQNLHTYGINFGATYTNVPAGSTAADGTYSQKCSGKGTITGGSIYVENQGLLSYGILHGGNYNSYESKSHILKISNCDITVKAYQTAYGIYANASIGSTSSSSTRNLAAMSYGDVELTNCTVYTEATVGTTAYAVYGHTTYATIFADQTEYDTSSKTNISQTRFTGEYAIGAKIKIVGGTYTAKAATTTAYAVCTNTRSKTIYGTDTKVEAVRTVGGNAEGYVTLIIDGGTFIGEATTTTARAVSSGGYTTITGGTFNATAGTYYAYALYALSGKLTATNSIINATANGRVKSSDNNAYAYGALADCGIVGSGNQAWTGFTYFGEIELNNCTVTATATTYDNARGISVNATSALLTQANYEAEKTKRKWDEATTWAAYQAVFPGDNTSRAVAAKAKVTGGSLTVTAGRANAYGAFSTKTAITNTQGAMASPEMTLTNVAITSKTRTNTTAYGVYSGGSTTIDGCTITATAGDPTYKSTASGVLNVDKTTAIKNSTITATATDAAYGLEGRAEINATHGYCWHGEFDLSEAGNTIVTAEAKTKAKTAYTIFLKSAKLNIATGGAFDGDYATAASATINGGTYNAKFNTSGSAYVISLGSQQIQGDAVAQPEVLVNGGFFNGSTAEVGTAGIVGHMQLKGGYFVHPTNLATYAVAPKSVWTLPTTHEHYNPYYYKIAEHYNIVFMNGTTQLQQKDMEVGSIPAYSGATPTKAADATNVYTFAGWSDGVSTYASADIPAVSGAVTYTATYNSAPTVASVTVSGNTTYYATIEAAFAAANSSVTYDPTITLLRDASTTTTTYISYTGARNCTLNLNEHTLSSTTAQALLFINKAGITFTITDLTESKSGTLHLESTSTDNRWCVYVSQGNLQMDAGTISLHSKANQFNEGVRIDPVASTFTMNGGKVYVVTSDSKTACGIDSRGVAVINGGEIQVEASGAGYGIEARVKDSNIGNVTVYGGKFLVTGTTAACAYKSAANATLKLQGGYYNNDTELEEKCATNYHVLPNADATYQYKVAEAYQLTWDLDGGTVTTAGTQAPVDATGTPFGYVAKGATLTAPVVEKTGYTFDGWNTSGGTAAATMPAANTTYTATWVAAIADRELDIVDWTSNSITINVTNLKAVGGTNKNNWKIYVNNKDYTRTSPECSTQSRTLTIPGLTLTPNDNLLIQLKNDADVIESQHNYKIPQIYTANATLSGTTSSSVVYVYGGKLTISGNTTLAALYVCPGAEVEVTDGNTLTVGKLVLRTKPWATAAISGNVTATNVYYTRIAPDGSSEYPTGQYYQLGLPYACAISAVHLSDGTTPVYNSTWLLKSYNEERRAESGTSTNNWDALAADATIDAGRGYEMFSSYKYYREYYFPVTPTDNTSVAVTRHGEDKNNSGWNIVCSPLMSVYENKSNPVDGLKVSWLLADGSYDQELPETIWPVLPFSYQASATGYLDFSTNEFNQTVSAPRRAAYKENIQTEWIHLDVKDGNGVGDHTSVFVHPDRFEATYQTGIDVAKQSFTASRALIYSSHAYGEMAFAGVADVLLEQGVALTVYSPMEQELTISMRNNEWLDRMAYVWLIDNETGAQIDLLDSDYTFEAAAGTTDGRFILMGRFFAPQIATGIDEVDGEQAKARKIIIQDKMYILLNGQLYDATGKQVNK
jgi:uncharacterized repeat protein (TIGR02543 family)